MSGFFIFMIYGGGALKTFSILRDRGCSWFVTIGCSALWPATLGEWLAERVWK